jgi:hypothetical protein
MVRKARPFGRSQPNKARMLRICRNDKQLTPLQTTSLTAAGILECDHLRDLIHNSPDGFFAELSEKLFILGKEVHPSEKVLDRIDLLATDKQGNLVVIELKRRNDKLQLLQAISYAGMIARWSSEDVLAVAGARADALSEFLDVEAEELNRAQRLLLVAEAYDFEVLASAEWLYNSYSVDVMCARVALAVDPDSGAEYLSCNRVFPTVPLDDYAISRRRASARSVKALTDWDHELASVENSAMAEYFREQVDAGREAKAYKRILYYRLNGKRTWSLRANREDAYAWQYARFDHDKEFWQQRLSEPERVQPVKDGRGLRFFLSTASDLMTFDAVATTGDGIKEWFTGLSDAAGEAVAEDTE